MCLCDGHRTSSAVSKQQFYSLILIFGKWVKLLQRKSGEWSRCWGKIEDSVFWVFSLKEDVTAELCSFTVRTKSQFTTGWMLGGEKKHPHLTWRADFRLWKCGLYLRFGSFWNKSRCLLSLRSMLKSELVQCTVSGKNLKTAAVEEAFPTHRIT